jgi:hypothetical protein
MTAAAQAQPSAPASPPQIAAQATELLDLMMRLADLLAHETERVRSGHIQDVGPLQKEKLRLTLLYQRGVKQLEASGAKIAALPAPLRAQVVAASARLAETVAENERALRIGSAATRRLVDMLVESIKSRLKPLTRYSAVPGKLNQAPVLAVALDRRL